MNELIRVAPPPPPPAGLNSPDTAGWLASFFHVSPCCGLNHFPAEPANAGLLAPMLSSRVTVTVDIPPFTSRGKKKKKKGNQRLATDTASPLKKLHPVVLIRHQEAANLPPFLRLSPGTIAAPRHWTDVRFIWVSVTSSSSICQCGWIRFTSVGFTAFFPLQLFGRMYLQSCTHTQTRAEEVAVLKSILHAYLLYTNPNRGERIAAK